MLKIHHVTKHYAGTNKGITDLSLHVEAGDIYAFVGHNGAGKTTALKAVVGIHAADGGKILVDGIDIAVNAIEAKRRLAYIPDNPDLFEYMTGMQYLDFIADVFSLDAATRRERVKKYAASFGITDALGELIASYSHGMKQKLAIIGALIHAPRLLILDEPFVGLDPQAAVTLKDYMRQLCADGGAVFFSTHILEVAERLCNKVAVIKNGRLVASGDMAQVIGDKTSLEALFMEVAQDA